MYWRGACVVPLYKRKDDKYECSNSRVISFLIVVGKLYGSILISRSCVLFSVTRNGNETAYMRKKFYGSFHSLDLTEWSYMRIALFGRTRY